MKETTFEYYLEMAQLTQEGIIRDKWEDFKNSILGVTVAAALGVTGLSAGGMYLIQKHIDNKLADFNNGKTVSVSYAPRRTLGIQPGIGFNGKMQMGVGDTVEDSKSVDIKLIIDPKYKKIEFKKTGDNLITVYSDHKLSHKDVRKLRRQFDTHEDEEQD